MALAGVRPRVQLRGRVHRGARRLSSERAVRRPLSPTRASAWVAVVACSLMRSARSRVVLTVLMLTGATVSARRALAQDPGRAPSPARPTDAAPAPALGAGDGAPLAEGPRLTRGREVAVAPAASLDRRSSLEPKLAAPPPPKTTFESDPIVDGAVIGVSLGFAGILDLIDSTGEVRPQQIAPDFDRSDLLGIDRGAVAQTIDPNASSYSNIGLFTAGAFAVLDPILTGFREESVQSGLVDGILYAEAVSVTFGLTNLAKLAVRRPRPNAYLDAEAHKNDANYLNTQTDSALSFFSGHASITATIGATATYLAFARAPRSARPWATLFIASALTTFVSIERVRAGKHFPTDVIAGSIAGAGVGVMVPHLHRSEDIKQRQVWIGFSPFERGGGSIVHVSGVF
ncbi:phosphatase PAP2 family protein [Sorangium sp. So ce291]|uniref:phosphatase PAP2 family protein n=1 Tax=Sorangium sp. So ce291 TaxID=3133294 RepID=UPI003F6308E4